MKRVLITAWPQGWYTHDREVNPAEAVLDEGGKYTLKNVWLGVTVENQDSVTNEYQYYYRYLLQFGLSVEPMLGLVDLTGIRFDRNTIMNVLEGCGINRLSCANPFQMLLRKNKLGYLRRRNWSRRKADAPGLAVRHQGPVSNREGCRSF